MPDIIPMSNIIQKDCRRVGQSFLLFDVIPHSICAFVGFFVEILHYNEAFNRFRVGVLCV